MKAANLVEALDSIRTFMKEHREELIKLDQQNGDGDLGISMSDGFEAAYRAALNCNECDLGKMLMICGKALNEAAPSSLGTILSLGMAGMAKKLKGVETADLGQLANAMEAGVSMIMEKAQSKPGEKTVLDALIPAIEALKNNNDGNVKSAFSEAVLAAEEGSERTKSMRSVHGRAAYYGDKSIGLVDGGSVAAVYIFQAIEQYISTQ